jgi:DNA uptake protein ComE-like DNA-binding protein
MIIEDLTSFNNDNNQLFQENIDNLISINQAALKTLTTLPSVGEVRGQAIIDNRPYTKIEELLTNEVVTETIFEKIKNLITL